MKKLLVLLIVLIATVWLGVHIKEDPGYALFSYGHWTMEMPLWLAIVIMLFITTAIFYILRLLQFMTSMGSRLSAWQRRRRAQNAHRQLDRGLIELTEGRWQTAEKLLAESAEFSDLPLISFLTAARAAHEQGAYQRRDNYLLKADQATKKAKVAVSLTQAELQLSHRQFEQALATLNHLRTLIPNHTYVLRLLKRLYAELKEWQSLADLLPLLRKYHVLKPAEIDALAITTYAELMKIAAQEATVIDIKTLWQQIPRELQQDPKLLVIYSETLMTHGEADEAANLLHKGLKKRWCDECVHLYGKALTHDPQRQLLQVEQWLKDMPTNAILLLAAGRLALRCELWGKARSYLEASIQNKALLEAYALLGNLLENILHEHEAAFDCYRQAVVTVH